MGYLVSLLAPLVLFLPLFSAAFCGLLCRIITKGQAHFISCGALLLAACFSWVMLLNGIEVYQMILFHWVDLGDLRIDWSIYIDKLTCIMLVVVNTVSALVHIYSIGYMSEDDSNPRFFSYLSLFTFFMLLLVCSNNFLQLFVGWEGVGLCSYLLIGFWFKKNSANLASMKAFIVNRVGDFGLLIGICLVFVNFGSLEFEEVYKAVQSSSMSQTALGEWGFEAICILLFIGCMGKSAQLGLHTWLPDAMEGPTPVSALIHAATMVTAGVFLIARCYFLFEMAPIAREIVTVLGAATSVFAASVALVQTDIKRIIAYSTCSQLGYMFMACGVSDYSAAIFHLATHAFFKALLFLGAGSIIYASHHQQDIYKLRCKPNDMKVSYVSMWVGSLALGGFFPLSGFYSKDLIIESLNVSGAEFAYVVSLLVAALTVFYSWRTIIVVFHNPQTCYENSKSDLTPLPGVMLCPLIILIVFACLSGFIGHEWLSGAVHSSTSASVFWNDSIGFKEYVNIPLLEKFKPLIISVAALALAFIVSPMLFKGELRSFRALEACTLLILLATFISPVVTLITFVVFLIYKMGSFLHTFLWRHWYFNELYERVLVLPIHCLGHLLWKFIDVKVIDGLGPVGVARTFSALANRVSCFYTGKVLDYGMFVVFMVVGLITVSLFSLVLLN